MKRPVLGLTCDVIDDPPPAKVTRYASRSDLAPALAEAGATPIILPPRIDRIEQYISQCDGFILSGGDDPDTRPFGQPLHPKAMLIHPERQAFETALLEALFQHDKPVLGICLGMQMMALVAGGSLHQHLSDAPGMNTDHAAAHADHNTHAVEAIIPNHALIANKSSVVSFHHQAVDEPGSLRVVARSDDASGNVIEAIDHPEKKAFTGVQWHPERTADPEAGTGLLRRFVQLCHTG